MLTERRKHFYREYVKDFNIKAAMLRAGFAESTAGTDAYKLLRDPQGAAYLKTLMDKVIAKQELTAERVVEEMRRLAMSDIAGFYKWSEKKKTYVLKPLDELTPEQTAAIAKYEPGKCYTLWNKDSALDKLGKYFKLYSEIPALVQNYMIMPTVKINGVEHVFEVGKPKKPR